ncbi:hypothetical protein G9A89_021959 [Geosiphon pyriformis]|nr:hypothetical protein G9A89_021959 [Geosiphon pyriformis]
MLVPNLPSDIIQHILANLSIKEIYVLRRVNHEWFYLFEHALMEHMTTHESQILVRVGPKPTPALSMALSCVGYEPKTGIFTFKPVDRERPITCKRWNLRQVKILFGDWNGVGKTMHNNNVNGMQENPIMSGLTTQSPLEANSVTAEALTLYANIKFHVDYVEAVLKEYQVSISAGQTNDSPNLRYITEKKVAFMGDKDMICKCRFKYILPDPKDQNESLSVDLDDCAVSFDIDFVKVRSSWIFSGLSTHSPMPSHQIYESRYALLDQLTSDQDIDYNRYASIVLDWVTSSAGIEDEKTITLLKHLKLTEGDFNTRELLARALEAKGVTPHHMWKFGIVRRFLANPESSSMTFDQIVEKVVLTQSGETQLSTPTNSKNAESKLFRWNFARFS